jgi:pimeloyl-ACP methyl ester carboxylesterase
MTKHKIEPPYYPIVYVRGYAMTADEREDTFYDSYYGFAANSVEKREAPPPVYFQADVFEGQLIRFMKLGDYRYADASNAGIEEFGDNPSRSMWVCRFYDIDFFSGKTRDIKDHARELETLIRQTIPEQLRPHVELGKDDADYKVILIAHSMGGLVCRALIQNLLPAGGEDPKRWIHRFVTMGTPHGGIELGRIPDIAERLAAENLNPFNSGIFFPRQMRDYLKLDEKYDVQSLGPQPTKREDKGFPIKRCLCLIGSNYREYSAVKWVTGDHSDGLVKQSRAYCVGGPAPEKPAGAEKPPEYLEEQVAFYANVHRAHSGRVGIVNSYESFENIHRFLFGNIRARVYLNEVKINTPVEDGFHYFYDFEFFFSVRRTGVYLHRRQQDPCENAWRFHRAAIPGSLLLHTGFMNSRLNDRIKGRLAANSHCSLSFGVIERRSKQRLLWDKEYPARQIYNETLELRIGGVVDEKDKTKLGYRWLSDGGDFKNAVEQEPRNSGVFEIDLREAGAVSGKVQIVATPWPDPALTLD